MFRLPQVLKGVTGFQFPPRYKEGFEQSPNMLPAALKLGEEQPRVVDVKIVPPCNSFIASS